MRTSAAVSRFRQSSQWIHAVLPPLLLCAGTFSSHAQTTTVTRSVEIEYDLVDGLVKKEITEPGDATYRVTVEYERNAHGVVTKRTTSWQDPLTAATQTRIETTEYDVSSLSRYPTKTTNAKGHIETRTFAPSTGNVLEVKGPNEQGSANATTWQYDGWGRETRETRVDGTATSTAYRKCIDACSSGATAVRITQNWSGASQTTVPSEEFTDALGRTVGTRSWAFDGTAVLSEKVYDSLGRVERIGRPRFATASAVWTWYDDRDPIGRVNAIRSPHQSGSGFDTTTFAYDGLRLVVTNAKAQTRSETRNGLGKLKSVIDANAKTTSYLYDPFGNLARTTDPLGNQINVTYDRLGRKTQLADPALGTWTYVVDPLGQTRRQTDAKGQQTTFDFDELGRMIRRLEPDMDSRWDYDTAAKGIGKLAEAYTLVGGTSTKDYRRIHGYDSLGRPSGVTTSLDWDYVSTTTYDGFGRTATETHTRSPKGGSGGPFQRFTYAYNARGYLSSFSRANGGSTLLTWQATVQDQEGRITHEQYSSNGAIKVVRSFNAYTGRLQGIVGGTDNGSGGVTPSLQNDSYAYDSLGNLVSRSQLAASAGALVTEAFDYDALNRLSYSQISGQGAKSYGYDDAGNLRSKGSVGVYSYPVSGAGSRLPHAVSSITGSVAGLTDPSFDYDANGNLTNGLGRAYGWTSYNQPGHIDKLSGAAAVQRTGFLYGPEYQRIRQTISPVSGGSVGTPSNSVHYAGAIEKEVSSASNKTLIRTYLPRGAGYVEEAITGTAVASSASASAAARFVLRDHLGSVHVVVNSATDSALQRLSYDAWGRRRDPSGADDSWSSLGTIANDQDNSGYAGHEQLDQLGLVHMNARLYDPILGRHTSADPTVPDPSDAQSLNRYSYVLNNALAFVDPTGLGPRPINETIDGAVRRAAQWQAAIMTGSDDPTFFDDLTQPIEERIAELKAYALKAQSAHSIQGSSIAGMSRRDVFTPVLARLACSDCDLPSLERIEVTGSRGFNLADWLDRAGDAAHRFSNEYWMVPGGLFGLPLGDSLKDFSRIAAGRASAWDYAVLGVGVAVPASRGVTKAAKGTTTLYRAVSTAEHADIAAFGALRAGPNSFSEGKWFWESAGNAAQFGTKMDGAGNFKIVEATFPRSAADQFMRLDRLDGIGPARFGTFEQLGSPLLRTRP